MKVVYTETFATAVNTALKFASKISFFFCRKSKPWDSFGFAFRMGTRALKI